MPRTLSEQEFEAVKGKVLGAAPDGMSEADFTRWAGPAMEQAIGEAENVNATPEGSATGRFLGGAAAMLNPVTALKGLYSAATHPIDTAGSVLQSQLEQLRKAHDDYAQGRYSEMVGHGAAGLLPVLGPAAAGAGERMAAGDVAGGAGEAAGLLAPLGAVPAAKAVSRGVAGAARAVPGGRSALEAVANMADRAATDRLVDVAGPKVGPNKMRLNNDLNRIAPDILRDENLSALSRQGLQVKVEAKLADATAALDDASNARLSARTFETQPILDDLMAKRGRLTSQAVEGSRLNLSGSPIGQDVVPGPNAGRVAQIDQAIAEVKQLGPVARYEPLRRIREAYDGPAKTVYSPSMTADYLAKRGESLGAADVTGVLREKLASMDPETAAANADYALYKTANDVLKATDETERARPRVGRNIVARAGGAVAGAQTGGVPGAIAGAVLGQMVERAVQLAPTMKIIVARKLASIADLLRAGKAVEAQAAFQQTRTLLQKAQKVASRTAVPLGRAVEPLRFPMAAENQEAPPSTTGRR